MEPKTAKEIQAYKVRTLIFLLIILGLLVLAIYQFYMVQQSKAALEKKVQELENANTTIDQQGLVIEQKATIEKQKIELDEAISLLGILVNGESDAQLDNEYILSHLHELAKEKEVEIEELNKKRTNLIKGIFSSNESIRKNTVNEILRNHSSDLKLISQLMDATEGEIAVNKLNPLYQIIYTLERVSDQSIKKNKTKIQNFLNAITQLNHVGPSTKAQMAKIERRLR